MAHDDGRPLTALFARPLHGADAEQRRGDLLDQRARLFGRRQPYGARDKVLVIALRGEAHADAVVARLVARGVPVCRFDVDTFGDEAELSLTTGEAGISGRIVTSAGTFATEEIAAVWLHRPIFELFGAGPTRDNLGSFVRREREAALRGLFDLVADAFWVNPAAALYAATSKPMQLCHAAAVGLTLPRTLVTNRPDEAAAFFAASGGRVIAKAFRGEIGSGWHDTEIVYAQRLTEAHLAELPRLRHAPCIFQELVDKASELRVTVVGDRLFPVEIRFADGAPPPDDYRRAEVEASYAACALPPELERACARLVERCGLGFAAIDFIRRPDGAFVFLELNAYAAWLWLEALTGIAVSDAVAELLAGAATGSSAASG